ncbi:MAG: hypothetical protein E5299_00183 [Burkholderia gladioli]|nr:MAG: hypothetical protein E5299_00183 [Burkholderia gladioli]
MNDSLTGRNLRSGNACNNGCMTWLGVVGTGTAGTAENIDLFDAQNLVEQLSQSVIVSHIPMCYQRGMHLSGVVA